MFDEIPEPERGGGGESGTDCGVFLVCNNTRAFFCSRCLNCMKLKADELELIWDLVEPAVEDISGHADNMGFNWRLGIALNREAKRSMLDFEEELQREFLDSGVKFYKPEEPEPDG